MEEYGQKMQVDSGLSGEAGNGEDIEGGGYASSLRDEYGDNGDNMMGDPSITPDQTPTERIKHKRRSKHDVKGRDFKCGCGKQYLSYPALYTHIKTKHNGVNPSGTDAPQYHHSRGRGRPRKTAIPTPVGHAQGQPSPSHAADQKSLAASDGKEEEAQKKAAESSVEEEVFKKLDVKLEEPYNPIKLTEEFIKHLKEFKAKSYLWLEKHLKNIEREEKEESKKEEIATIKKNCDRVFAEFLWDMSKKVNDRFFLTLLVYIKQYAECLNEYGWEILKKYTQIRPDELKKNYVLNYDAEHVPEICNDFLRFYLPRECPYFNIDAAIEITKLLCEWLNKRKFTQTIISLL